MPLFDRFWNASKENNTGTDNDDDDDTDESDSIATDKSAKSLNYIGKAAYDVLRTKHGKYHHELWNVSHNSHVVDHVWNSPRHAFIQQPQTQRQQRQQQKTDPPKHHDDWFPQKLGTIIARTEEWCDVLSLAPPDGLFMKCFQEALAEICNRRQEFSNKRVVVRMLFGNIIGMPVNCDAVIRELTKGLPKNAESKLKLWVGSWRKGVSWNHAKIIAVDGKYLWTGGHNLWDRHYLRANPVNDLSIELSGPIARDGHIFANAQWGYILKKQSTAWGRFVDKRIPDGWDVPRRARVTVSEFPMKSGTAEFPPKYSHRRLILRREMTRHLRSMPIISMGRYGVLVKKARPSDDAIVAIFDAAKRSIRIAVQDLGPVLLPGTKMALPGSVWPYDYLNALARSIWLKGVDVEIILSNPFSVPGHCSPTEAQYGFGWDCVDVAAEIIKAIKTQYPDALDGDLRQRVQDNLRLCFIRSPTGSRYYEDGQPLGLHSKHFIVDDAFCYIGSQNLYICDLAEWGICIDDVATVLNIKAQYWDPLWKMSYTGEDCDVDQVMDGLKIDRSAPSRRTLTKVQLQQAKEKVRASLNIPRASTFHLKKTPDDDFDALERVLEEDTDDEISEGES